MIPRMLQHLSKIAKSSCGLATNGAILLQQRAILRTSHDLDYNGGLVRLLEQLGEPLAEKSRSRGNALGYPPHIAHASLSPPDSMVRRGVTMTIQDRTYCLGLFDDLGTPLIRAGTNNRISYYIYICICVSRKCVCELGVSHWQFSFSRNVCASELNSDKKTRVVK